MLCGVVETAHLFVTKMWATFISIITHCLRFTSHLLHLRSCFNVRIFKLRIGVRGSVFSSSFLVSSLALPTIYHDVVKLNWAFASLDLDTRCPSPNVFHMSIHQRVPQEWKSNVYRKKIFQTSIHTYLWQSSWLYIDWELFSLFANTNSVHLDRDERTTINVNTIFTRILTQKIFYFD